MEFSRLIQYSRGWKYRLEAVCKTSVPELKHLKGSLFPFIHLEDGVLTIAKGYAWDGPSGPAFDTSDFMRASLVHDALYQLIREKEFSQVYRMDADRIMKRICEEDGMPWLRVQWCYWAVRKFGPEDGGKPKQMEIAP